jgi:outer membrane receptor protein involved in Fe transport
LSGGKITFSVSGEKFMANDVLRGVNADVTCTKLPRKTYALTPLAAAVVAALGPAGPVIAQEDESQFVIDEILVTATKRELGLQDVPQSIDVLSGIQLEQMGAMDLEATMRALPSVHLTALQPGQNQLTMRGVGAEVFEYTRPALVAVYLDEQPMTSNAQQVGFRNIDINRVESLPGPQGTLFGSSSLAGTLRFISNKPNTDRFEGYVQGRVGSTSGGANSHDISGVVNVPLIEDKLAVRLVGYSSHDGGYVDNVFGTSFTGNYDNAELVEKDHNEFDVDGGRLHVQWNLNEKWSTLISFTAENTSAPGAWDSDAALDDYQVTRFYEEFRDDEWTSVSLTLNGDLGFADLSLTGTRFERDIVYEYDNMAYSQARDYYYAAYCPDYYGYYFYCTYVADYLPSNIFNDQVQERDAYELRLVSKGDGKLQWVVGAYYEDFLNDWVYGSKVPGLENTTMFYWSNYYAYYYGVANYYNNYTPNPNIEYPLPLTDISWTNDYTYSEQQTAVFGEISYDLTDQLMVFGGARWAEVDRDRYELNLYPAGLVPYGARDDGGDGSFRDVGTDSDTIFKAGLQYDLSDDIMVYGLYSQGFRVGGANSQRAASTGLVPQTYGSDFLNNYEIGIKSKLADGRVVLNASAFSMVWDDYLQGVSGEDWWAGGTVNAGEAEASGLEVSLIANLSENLSFSTNLGFFDNEFKDDFCANYENNVNLGCVDDTTDREIVAGMTMPNAPKFKAWASLNYNVPNVLGGDLWFYYDFAYQDESWSGTDEIRDNDLDGLTPSMTISNFSTGLRLPNELDITVTVNNLFDQNGYTYTWTGEGGNADRFGSDRYQRQRAQHRPRTVWLTLKKGFGGT